MKTFFRLWITCTDKKKFIMDPATLIRVLGGEPHDYDISTIYTECGKTIVEVTMPDRNMLTVRNLLRQELRNIRRQGNIDIQMFMETPKLRLVI